MDWQDRLEDLKKRIAAKRKVLVAFSGGVDSSLLAKVARDVLGENSLCVVLDSETMPRSELKYAEDLARSLNLNYEIAEFSILADEGFVQNPPTRCYICRKASSRVLWRIAQERGMSCIADGLNLSDYKEYRPGTLASTEEGIWHPFVDAGIFKVEIREMAREMGLPFWNKPSSACLSSRIPYFERITKESLKMVEEAEDYLKGLGFGQLRVRAHSRMARIELPKEEAERALHYREAILRKLKAMGFEYVALDLEGLRSGSMNEALRMSEK